MLLRISLVIPIVFSAVSIGLGIALLAAGDTSGGGFYLMALNMSRIGQDVVQLNTVNDTAGGSGSSGPGSSIPDIMNPGGIFDGLGNAFDNAIDNITTGINEGVMDLQGELIGSLTKTLGIKDVYVLYLSKICEGDFINPDDPGSDFNITECSKYSDSGKGLRNVSSSIPSSFAIGRTNISVPLVAGLGSTVGSVTELGTGAATAVQVFGIIAVIGTGLMFLGSLFAVLFLRRVTAVTTMLLGSVGSVAYLITAIVGTVIAALGSSAIGGIGSTFGLGTRKGQSFLAMVWVGAVFALIANSYWLLVWFVEFRKTSFKRRQRTSSQIGNWRGILSELWGDLRLNRISKEFQ
ncbi:hypothetical protein HJFPF1_02077 [Paramyrothecium foliicola]|nr:hypothetical protein HJFPF1_02077 [Paramyrothecium foliicola]